MKIACSRREEIRREASINDLVIDESERRIFGPRPEGERDVEIRLR